MRNVLLILAAVALVIAASPASAAAKAAPKAPAARAVVVVFETEKGEGVDKPLAASATRALCSYLRETQRVDAITFDRESPTVLRAIMEKQITADQVASYSSQLERIAVAKALAYDYAAGAEISIKNNLVQLKLWVSKSNGGKKDKWETTTTAAIGSGGADNYDNAMQSATSAAVIGVARQAFMGLPVVAGSAPTTGSETTAIGSDLATPPTPPKAADYAAQADASVQAGNMAVAIQQYQQAVNADPTNAANRMKLADAYARKAMYFEAHAELSRAELMGAKADQVEVARKQIDAMQLGQRSNKVEPVRTQPNTDSVSVTASQPPKPDAAATAAAAKSSVSLMLAGDKLWRANKPDEAADAYKEAIKLNPSDWRAYERLALVDASVSMFTDSRLALEQLAKVQPDPTPEIIAKRYDLFSTIFTQWFTALFKQYDDDFANYAKRAVSRESYYSSVKGLSGRLESMAKFLDALQVPEDRKPGNLHRSLACGLVSQAASSLQDFLETNNKDSKSNAETFVAQAKKELGTVKSLEGNRVIVQKQPAPTPAPTQPPTTSPDANSPAPPDNSGQDPNAPGQPQPDNSGQDMNPPGPPATDNSGQDTNSPAPPGPPDTSGQETNPPGPPQPDVPPEAPPPPLPGIGVGPVPPPGIELL